MDSAKNLGVILDSELSFKNQINKVVKSCFFTLKRLASIRHYLEQDHLKLLVCSHIFSKIDYCNALYYKLDSTCLKRLQLVQNSAARLITNKRIVTNLDNIFTALHWLKVRERIVYKILLTIHKCIHSCAPNSLSNLVKYADSARRMNLRVTKVKSKHGERSFSHAGPKLWNCLPEHVKNENDTDCFKKLLKSYLMVKGDEYNRRCI